MQRAPIATLQGYVDSGANATGGTSMAKDPPDDATSTPDREGHGAYGEIPRMPRGRADSPYAKIDRDVPICTATNCA